MAICKDCFHWESCRAMFEAAGGIIVPDDFKGSAVRCKHFVSTADVAPRAEVAREIFEEIEREITDALKSNYKVLPQIEQSEELWNRVKGKIDALRGVDGFIAELKKKYMEGGDE